MMDPAERTNQHAAFACSVAEPPAWRARGERESCQITRERENKHNTNTDTQKRIEAEAGGGVSNMVLLVYTGIGSAFPAQSPSPPSQLPSSAAPTRKKEKKELSGVRLQLHIWSIQDFGGRSSAGSTEYIPHQRNRRL